ncbi:MAG: pyruvate dehydrogenase (acetyl-transferring) E1 component subunit alpha [Euryarchaeota archaeon]|nr:pyruvate dehydrogenase (acetyl-transferring) E1 component subunit alpha [Euryarchaeota archaeon]MDE1836227.1 pyruvate dehydrogenase (acetyl-transferring) E1 component subunit alpha [Euryarchaeota archaeon]MDE1880880.1 pyruvate dehydrogenase (acetyl-transferring) E1 component subunit alpha [Euryarchaeota archaeon]MDE2045012.1 pyruvate dehydrogenase (acetyl-transferring) E1 component subunit alpha [Thermoplasmata archaeon]
MSAAASRTTTDLPEPSLPDPDLLKVLRTMALARAVDERCMNLQRQGRLGFYVPLEGQEAAQVGCAWALQPGDWVCPAYRELAVALTRGVPLRDILNQLYGNSADLSKGRQMPNHYGFRQHRFLSASSPIGTQIIHAVGLAYASRYKGEKVVAVPFFGDGATSSNDFHSGMNFAGVYKAPVVFFCQNNQWAISLPREKQTHSSTLAIKANAYGFPGVQVDGNDFHAVYRAVKEARARAVAGEGPTLIEAVTYRMGPHSTSDDPRRYRTPQELATWKARDPIERLKSELLARGVFSEAQFESLQEELRSMVQKEVQEVEKMGPPAATSLFDDVWASLSPNLEEERKEFEELLREGVIRP